MPNSRSITGRWMAKLVSMASGASAWCQWWNRGVTTSHSMGLKRKRMLVWMNTAWNETKTR